MTFKKEKIIVKDMHCTSCEKIIEKKLNKLDGILNVIASYEESCVYIEYDSGICSSDKIKMTIEKAGYTVGNAKNKAAEMKQIIGVLIIAVVIVALGKYSGTFNMDTMLQQEVTFFVLFIVGLFTSIHCVGMCGGIMLSQSVSSGEKSKWASIKPSLLYNTGRVISYTILGGIVGAIGSVFSISLYTKSIITIFAGAFMIIMGLNMAGFNFFRKLHIKLPWSACSIKNKSKAPFIVGLLNGFMPCGPLQTMQLYALGTGSAVKGAFSMFAFSLGTVPLMLSFGLATSLLNKGYSKKILKFSGVLVLFLGIIMTNRGLALSGIDLLPKASFATAKIANNSELAFAKAEIKNGVQILKMTADYSGYTPNVLYVQKDLPVKWIIDGQGLTSCNNAIIIPSMNIQQKLTSGENVIEFTPGEEDINFSCWMGMIRGVIKVTDNLETVDTSDAANQAPSSSGGSCCSTGGYNEPVQESIYGDDISKTPTKRLIKKAVIKNNIQSLSIKGIGYELEPLVIVLNKDIDTVLSFDLNSYDYPNYAFDIVDVTSQEIIKTFEADTEVVDISLKFETKGVYAITQGDSLLGIIEVVDNLDVVDLDEIRKNYFK
jgi:sulfite exporter TauE/SafE/plastocyanin domain-containing protein/copper chaperone CopZ